MSIQIDFEDILYDLVLKYHNLEEKDLTSDESNFLFEQCQDKSNDIDDFIKEQKDMLEEYKKDRDEEDEE